MKLSNFVRLRCPVCQKGKLFRGYLDTPHRCPACGFYFVLDLKMHPPVTEDFERRVRS